MLVQSGYLSDPEFQKIWAEYKKMRKKKKRELTESAEKRQLNRVQKLYDGLGGDLPKLISHLEVVCDSLWDNVYSNEDHYNNIITQSNGTAQQGRSANATNTSGNGRGFKQATNYYTFDKSEKYFDSAEKLQLAMQGFDFVARIAEQ